MVESLTAASLVAALEDLEEFMPCAPIEAPAEAIHYMDCMFSSPGKLMEIRPQQDGSIVVGPSLALVRMVVAAKVRDWQRFMVSDETNT